MGTINTDWRDRHHAYRRELDRIEERQAFVNGVAWGVVAGVVLALALVALAWGSRADERPEASQVSPAEPTVMALRIALG